MDRKEDLTAYNLHLRQINVSNFNQSVFASAGKALHSCTSTPLAYVIIMPADASHGLGLSYENTQFGK